MTLVLLSGGIGAGKSSAANAASAATGIRVLRMRHVLAAVTGADPDDRAEMQRLAAGLDESTGGRWLVAYLEDLPEREPVIVDAIRTLRQARAVTEAFAGSRVVYLDADEATRRRRYEAAQATDRMKALMPFAEAMGHPTELEAFRIRDVAASLIDTNELDVDRVAERIVVEFDI